MVSTESLTLIITVVLVIVWLGGLVSWCYGAYYMWKTMHSWRPGPEWGRFLPFSLAFPSFFTDEGNRYRVRLLCAMGVFILCVGGTFGIVALSNTLGVPVGSSYPAAHTQR